jgi:hypothetical protein
MELKMISFTPLKISEVLQNEDIVISLTVDGRCIHAKLNHTYKDVTIISDTEKKSWTKTVKNFNEAATKKGVSQKHLEMLDSALADNYQTILEQDDTTDSDNEAGPETEEEHKKPYPTFKYSNNGKGVLHEAVIVAGLPFFVKYDKVNNKLEKVEKIEEPSRVLRPPNPEEYPNIPYEFANDEELQYYLNKSKEMSIYSIYQAWKSIVKKYNDQDEHKQILITTDLVWTYFQDKFPTTHYHAAIGDNGSGKSSIGDTFEYGAYRCVNLTNPSAPNVFRILGPIEPGQCTLILDEADRIEESSDMQSILKTGNRYGKRVSKVNNNSWKTEYFYTYCWKCFLAEVSPNQWKSKGVLTRTLLYTSFKGTPSRLIEETTSPQGDPDRQRLLDELLDLRKLSLIYRLIHFADPILDIDAGVTGRNMQLVKPYIQLFYNTPAQEEVEKTLQTFLDIKDEDRSTSIEAMLLPIIKYLLSEEETKGGTKIKVSRLWDRIKSELGEESPNCNPNECYTDWGILYRNSVTKLVKDKFGAQPGEVHGGRSALIFNHDKLRVLESVYGIQPKIHTTLKGHDYDNGEDGEGFEGSTGMPIPSETEKNDNNGKSHEEVDPDNMASITKDTGSNTQKSTEKGTSVLPEPQNPSPPPPPSPLPTETESETKQLDLIFWSIYTTVLEKERNNPANHMTADKDTVGRSELIVALYDSGYFSNLEAKKAIARAIQSNKLKVVALDTYRKV